MRYVALSVINITAALLLAPPLSGAAIAGYYTCGSTRTSSDRCPDGSIAMYHADEVRPTAPGGGGRNVRPGGGEIEFYKGGPGVHVFTREERDRMNHNIDAAAQELARKWGNRPMNAAQLRALEEQRCRMAAAYNPDVVCR